MTGIAARDVESGLKKVGVPEDVANEFGRIVGVAGPHNWTEAALNAAGLLIPFAGKAAPLFEEAAPAVANFLKAAGEAPAMSLKGAGARALTTGAITGATAAATGEPVTPAVAEGAGVSAVAEPLGVLASKASGLSTAEKGAAETATESAIAKTQTEAISKGTAVTPVRAGLLAKESPGAAETLADAKRALKATRNAVFEEKGQKFEPFYGPANARPLDPVDVDQIHAGAQQSIATVDTRGQARELSAGVRKQIGDLADLKTVSDSDAATMVREAYADSGLERAKQRHPELLDAIKQADADRVAAGIEKPLGLSDFADLAQKQSGTTIGQLRGKLSSLMGEALAPSATATDRRAIFEATQPITKILDDAVPEELRPALQKVKDEYAQAINLFPWRQQRALHVASTLPELGETFFEKSKPAAIDALIKRATPEQQGLFREAFGSFLWKKADQSPDEALKILAANKDVVAQLFPKTEFQNIGAWADMIRGASRMSKESLEKAGLPARREFLNGLSKQIKGEMTPEMIQGAEAALRATASKEAPYIARWATRMGPLGLLAGYGVFSRDPWLIIPLAGYLAGRQGWKGMVGNPEALSLYRQFITNGWTRAGGDALGRLMLSSIKNTLTAPPGGPPGPAAAAPPPPVPLPALGAAWMKAPAGPERDAMRAEMTRRVKSGEYTRMKPEEKKALNPVFAEMYRPKPEPHLGAGT